MSERKAEAQLAPVTDDELSQFVKVLARFIRCGRIGHGLVPAEVERVLQREGLGSRHVPVLLAVASQGTLSVGRIAERIALAPATTSQLVGELTRAGLVTREHDHDDGRRVLVRLAGRYAEPVKMMAAQRQEMLRTAMGRLTAEERAGFLRASQVFSDAAEEGLPEAHSRGRFRGAD